MLFPPHFPGAWETKPLSSPGFGNQISPKSEVLLGDLQESLPVLGLLYFQKNRLVLVFHFKQHSSGQVRFLKKALVRSGNSRPEATGPSFVVKLWENFGGPPTCRSWDRHLCSSTLEFSVPFRASLWFESICVGQSINLSLQWHQKMR